MQTSDSAQTVLSELISRLKFQPGGPDRAYGEVRGNPTTLTVLGGDPLALLLSLKIVSPHPESISLPAEIASLVAVGRTEASLEDGFGWLTLKDLSGLSSAEIACLVESFGEALAAGGLTFAPGCVACGCLEEAELVHAEGRCSRLCPACAERLVTHRQESERALNQPTVFHAFSLPLVFLYAAGGWLVFWFLIDLLLEWWQPDEIALPDVLLGLLILLLGGIGLALGYPLGACVRRSGVIFRSPVAATLLTVIPAALVGELLFITASVFWRAGFLDVVLAAQLFIPFVTSYPVSWVIGKLLVIGGLALGCYLGAKAEKKVAIRL